MTTITVQSINNINYIPFIEIYIDSIMRLIIDKKTTDIAPKLHNICSKPIMEEEDKDEDIIGKVESNFLDRAEPNISDTGEITFDNEDDDDFLNMFGKVIDNTSKYLEKGIYLAVVIGDKYSDGEWIPRGFYTMQEVMKRGFKLKSTIVKNFDTTKGKMNQKELWRYRALAGGFYIFKHEYIFLFQK